MSRRILSGISAGGVSPHLAWRARELYEDPYCARDEAENRIGERFELFADRTSCETMDGNQMRLRFSAIAYVLMEALRHIALKHTQFANAAVQTIRLKLLKLGTRVKISVWRVHFAMPQTAPTRSNSRWLIFV